MVSDDTRRKRTTLLTLTLRQDCMSWKDFLADYQAHEDEEIKHAQIDRNGKHVYPRQDRYPKLKSPFSWAGPECNIWGAIPFQGTTILPLSPAGDRERFDQLNSPLGLTSSSLNETIRFAKETRTLGFILTSPATDFTNLPFLEPLFREFRPPGLVRTPLANFVSYKEARPHLEVFHDSATHGFNDALRLWMHDVGTGRSSRLVTNNFSYFRETYVFLRTCGYPSLADMVLLEMVDNPVQAMEDLRWLGMVLVDPVLCLPGWTPVFTSNYLTSFEGTSGLKSVTTGKGFGIPDEIGRFFLRQIVRWPETIDGCRRIMEEYDTAGLARLRQDLYRAVQDASPGVVLETAVELEQACKEVWERLERYSWVRTIGSLTPTVAVGVVGELASGLPGVGAISAIGTAVVDKTLDGRIGDAVGRAVGALLGKNHMVALYDFKSARKTHPPH